MMCEARPGGVGRGQEGVLASKLASWIRDELSRTQTGSC